MFSRDDSSFSMAVIFLVAGIVLLPHVSKAEDPALSFTDADYSQAKLDTVLKYLDDPSAEVRGLAARRLALLGPEARPAIPKLIRLLADEGRFKVLGIYPRTVQREAYECLIAIGSEAVSELNDRFLEQPEKEQTQFVLIARQIGVQARSMLPHFVKLYESANDTVSRDKLLSAIAAVDPNGKVALPLVLKALRDDKSTSVRRTAATLLFRTESIPNLYGNVQHLYRGDLRSYRKDGSPVTRWIQQSPPDAIAAGNALIAALSDKSPVIRGHAATSLETYPELTDTAVPALLTLLGDKALFFAIDESVRNFTGATVSETAVLSLSRFPSRADEILAQLLPHANHDAWYRETISELLPHSKTPLVHLAAILESKHPRLAMTALCQLGPKTLPLVSQVEALTKHQDLTIADEATRALAFIDPIKYPRSVEAFHKFILDDPGTASTLLQKVGPAGSFAVPFLRQKLYKISNANKFNPYVIAALNSIGPGAIDAAAEVLEGLATGPDLDAQVKEDFLVSAGPLVLPMVVESLNDPQKSTAHRVACLRLLARLKKQWAGAVPAIIGELNHSSPRVREAAAEALGSLAMGPEASLIALQRVLNDPRPFVRAAAAESCGAFEESAQSVVPQLIQGLSDDYLDVRVAAATSLQRIGPVAKAATAKLTELMNDKDILIRESAQAALAAINKTP